MITITVVPITMITNYPSDGQGPPDYVNKVLANLKLCNGL
jgi:hypothetical protein